MCSSMQAAPRSTSMAKSSTNVNSALLSKLPFLTRVLTLSLVLVSLLTHIKATAALP